MAPTTQPPRERTTDGEGGASVPPTIPPVSDLPKVEASEKSVRDVLLYMANLHPSLRGGSKVDDTATGGTRFMLPAGGKLYAVTINQQAGQGAADATKAE